MWKTTVSELEPTEILSELEQILSTVNRMRAGSYPTLPSDLIEKIISIEKDYLDVPEDAHTLVQKEITEYLKRCD